MLLLPRLLLLGLVLSGCASAPPAGDVACCAAPAPGTTAVHLNGEVVIGVGIKR